MAKITISSNEVHGMSRHWLNTPVCGYLGSDYGQDLKALLQKPLSETGADAFLRKLRRDVPLLASLPAGSVNLYSLSSAPDKMELVLEVAGAGLSVSVAAS